MRTACPTVQGRAEADEIWVEKHRGEKLIVVTHGGVIKMFLREILEVNTKSFRQFQIDNTSITELKFYDDDVVLSKLNYLVGDNFK